MTMTFDVATASDLAERVPGELVTATLEVSATSSRLLDIKHAGSAPLPANTNEVALLDLLEVGDVVPDAALIDQNDRRRSLSEWNGTTTLVSLTYTTCPLPNFCPLMDRNLAALQERIAGDAALAGRVRLISITIDPAHDTPAVLADHAARLKADPAVWTFLTGDARTVDKVAGTFGVGIVRPDEPGEIKHNLRTTLVGKNGHVRAIYSGNEWTPESILGDIRASVAASE
jgi:protein SCO1/2